MNKMLGGAPPSIFPPHQKGVTLDHMETIALIEPEMHPALKMVADVALIATVPLIVSAIAVAVLARKREMEESFVSASLATLSVFMFVTYWLITATSMSFGQAAQLSVSNHLGENYQMVSMDRYRDMVDASFGSMPTAPESHRWWDAMGTGIREGVAVSDDEVCFWRTVKGDRTINLSCTDVKQS